MSLGFSGEVTEFYHRYRRGYPVAAFDAIAAEFTLAGDDVVLDLGCGTGQLAVPMAARVRAVVGMDTSTDMLARARRAGLDAGVTNASWLLGGDTDVTALNSLLGGLGAVTIGQALHWMDHPTLFAAVKPMLRPGGGIAVVTNGSPLWLQDSDWSRALLDVLSDWFGHPLTAACGTDDASQHRYLAALTNAGYDVGRRTIDYTGDLTADDIIGSVYSAMGEDELPPSGERPAFENRIRSAVEPHGPLREPVRVTILTGRV
ncbi:class I SAM-dependent methyltransferase [Amycolatopsis rhabdoformis]|uniref:Class I SAM-dependent methyltransferase n=1 Tax=Amycolatopsis rhabdoformis TaxID=1448059 RepID=A0ABZ1I9P0_9PSEU|nr:class I SAM-dependent methyltransferase [Amycolatopsis rhabdoformis]WSE30145.1 class I SAM-dependent methyltransferase [Amycolatopsis rhabdoformis]